MDTTQRLEYMVVVVSINVCVPLMGKEYLRALMEDVCEFKITTTMLVPGSNSPSVNPFVNNMIYDFKPRTLLKNRSLKH